MVRVVEPPLLPVLSGRGDLQREVAPTHLPAPWLVQPPMSVQRLGMLLMAPRKGMASIPTFPTRPSSWAPVLSLQEPITPNKVLKNFGGLKNLSLPL